MKSALLAYCHEFVDQRITGFQKAIDAAQASANEEGKSSAGDKYETGRAMMQLEIEKNTVQLAEAIKLKQTLNHIAAVNPSDQAILGSLVKTNNGYYYLSVSIGAVKIADETFFVISPASPIGQLLLGAKVNESKVFNGKTLTILGIS